MRRSEAERAPSSVVECGKKDAGPGPTYARPIAAATPSRSAAMMRTRLSASTKMASWAQRGHSCLSAVPIAAGPVRRSCPQVGMPFSARVRRLLEIFDGELCAKSSPPQTLRYLAGWRSSSRGGGDGDPIGAARSGFSPMFPQGPPTPGSGRRNLLGAHAERPRGLGGEAGLFLAAGPPSL